LWTSPNSAAPVFALSGLHKAYRAVGRGPSGGVRPLLRRRRETRPVLRGIDLAGAAGTVIGFVGPNGAGKSTTVKILAGILAPDAGEVRVCGLDPVRDRRAVLHRLALVMGNRSRLVWDLPARHSFRLHRRLYGLDRRACAARMAELEALLDIAPLLDAPVRTLSLGQRVRLDLALALLHRPALLVLDEASIGLDIRAKRLFRETLRRIAGEDGVGVLMATNDMEDVRRAADRVAVLAGGRLALDAPAETLRERLAASRRLEVEPAHGRHESVRRLVHGLVDGATAVRDGEDGRLLVGGAATDTAALKDALAPYLGDLLHGLRLVDPSLEDLIAEVVETP